MTSRPTTEHLLVQVLLRSLDTLMALRERPTAPDATVEVPRRDPAAMDEALRELELGLEAVWLRMSRVDLRCAVDGFWWGDEPVLIPAEAESSLDPTQPAGIWDVRSLASGTTLDGTDYAEL